MQHTQFHLVWLGILLALVAFVDEAAPPVLAAAIVHQARPDPLLDGTPDGPCAALVEGPEYAGTDATGHRVTPPDVGAPPIAVPDQIMMPLHTNGRHGAHRRTGEGEGSPYVAIDGHRLAPLVNPPDCESGAPPR